MIVYCVFKVLDEGVDKLVKIFDNFDAAAHFAHNGDYYFEEWEIEK